MYLSLVDSDRVRCGRLFPAIPRIVTLAVTVFSCDRAGQHSIRINDQWRICFLWKDGDAHEVEIVDYH